MEININELEDIFLSLLWIESRYVPTKLGKKNSAKINIQLYNKFVYWDKTILVNNTLLDAVTKYKDIEKQIQEYKYSVTEQYKSQGYILWDFMETETKKHKDINYIAKKNREIILMNFPNTINDITLDDIKEFELQKDEFIVKNPIFEDYDIKLQYNLSSFALSESAFKYIKDHTEFISYQIIK